MDPESNDKSSNIDTEESTMDSSPISINNVKEGVKKVLNSPNEDDSNMEVDKEDEQLSNNKSSETENGISDKNSDSDDLKNNDSENVKNDSDDNNQTVSSNHEQNEDEKDVSSENSTNKESDSAMDCEATEDEKNEEKEQIDKNKETVSESSELTNDQHSDTETKDAKKSADTDVTSDNSSKDDNSAEKDSKDVRPSDESSKVLSDAPDNKDTTKDDSTGKESKDSSKTEVSPGSSKGSSRKNEDKSSEKASTETESSKKDGEKKKKKSKLCEECGKKGLKFQVLFKGKTRFLCSDTCFKNFKGKQMQSKPPSSTAETATTSTSVSEKSTDKCGQCQKELSEGQKYYPVVGETKPLCSEECIKKYHADNFPVKNCSQCKKPVENPQNPELLTWETMVFCNEDCLGKYQSYLGSHCTCCQSPVPQQSLGKYSVCFGADIRQFCSCSCLDDFKKNLKVCSFCQTDLSSSGDSFLAPVGDKGQFKDFCTQNCMERYEIMNNISKNIPQTQVCSHCKKQGSFKIQVKHDNQTFALCGDLCVAGFRCAHKIKDKMCYTCFNFFNMTPEKDKNFSFKFDGQFKQFCTKACMTLFVLSHRKIVACASCKVKKYNFDMIEKQDPTSQTQIFCSLNCLSLHRVTINASSSKSIRCDQCTKTSPAQYHLTMSDGSIRNFCSYACVMTFQKQYTNVCTLTTSSATRQTSSSISMSTSKTSAGTSTPVISNVCSLARPPGPTLIRNIVPPKLISARPPLQSVAVINSKQAASTVSTFSQLATVTNASGQQVPREVIVKPAQPKSQKNKAVACKPIMQNKGITAKPQPCHKAVQTDDSPRPILLPVPVPYYVPVPVHMFSRPVPCPVPFPVPMFLPMVLPSKDSSNQEKASSSEENSSKKISNANNIKDGSKADSGSQMEIDKNNSVDIQKKNPSKGDELNCDGTTSETNDCGDGTDDDEYVFKDGKNHHHGKRHANSKNKGHKKSRMDDAADEVKSHNIVSSDENHNPSSAQNDHLEPAPHLKVP